MKETRTSKQPCRDRTVVVRREGGLSRRQKKLPAQGIWSGMLSRRPVGDLPEDRGLVRQVYMGMQSVYVTIVSVTAGTSGTGSPVEAGGWWEGWQALTENAGVRPGGR